MMESKHKRPEGEGLIAAWVFSVIGVLWLAFGITAWCTWGFDPAGAGLWSVMSFFIGLVLSQVIVVDTHIRTTEYVIYEYERYDWKLGDYVKYYLYDTGTIRCKFIYHYCLNEYEQGPTDPNEMIKDLSNSYNSWHGYENKEELMKDIIDIVRKIIANEKTRQNIQIRNVATNETLSLSDLKLRLEAGEFDETNKKSTDGQ